MHKRYPSLVQQFANSKVEKTSHPNRRWLSSKNIFSLMQTGCVLVSVNHIHQRIAEKEDEYGDGYSINFITENLTDKKIIVQYEDASLNDFMFYAVYSANLAPNKKSKDEIDMYESYDEYCPMEDLEYLEFKVAVLDGDFYDEICISDPVTISFE